MDMERDDLWDRETDYADALDERCDDAIEI